MAVGDLLRHWRGVRRVSQLTLALEAQTTARHVSFIETGRSQPSRAMVLRLARVLDVPIRERNQLLLAAGYAPVYPETGLAAEDASLVAAALERMLRQHEPYPAVVMDRHWNILDRNDAARALFGWLLGDRATRPRQPDPPVLRPRRPAAPRRQLGGRRPLRSSSASTARRSAACRTPARSSCSRRCSATPASRRPGARRT